MPGTFFLILGFGDWHCRLTVDAPGREAEVTRLFGASALPDAGLPQSEITLTLRGAIPEIRWQQHSVSGDLTLPLRSPEGKRFTSAPDLGEHIYRDCILGDAPALSLTDGALRVLASERWPLYLEFLLTWLMLSERCIISLHAAVCAAGDTALVLIGESGSGKSTLSAALSACGADFFGDENVFFDAHTGHLSVRPKTLGLRPGGLALLASLPAGQWHEAKANDPKCMVPLPYPSRPCPVDKAHLYFLDGFGPSPILSKISAGQSIPRLLRGMGHGSPSFDARLETASEIAARFPAWKLTLGSPEETARRLIGHVTDFTVRV